MGWDGMGWDEIGLDWMGLDWIGLDWIGLGLNYKQITYLNLVVIVFADTPTEFPIWSNIVVLLLVDNFLATTQVYTDAPNRPKGFLPSFNAACFANFNTYVAYLCVTQSFSLSLSSRRKQLRTSLISASLSSSVVSNFKSLTTLPTNTCKSWSSNENVSRGIFRVSTKVLYTEPTSKRSMAFPPVVVVVSTALTAACRLQILTNCNKQLCI